MKSNGGFYIDIIKDRGKIASAKTNVAADLCVALVSRIFLFSAKLEQKLFFCHTNMERGRKVSVKHESECDAMMSLSILF